MTEPRLGSQLPDDDPNLLRIHREIVVAQMEARARQEEREAQENLDRIAKKAGLNGHSNGAVKDDQSDTSWLTPVADLLAQPDEPVQWQIGGLIVMGGIAVMGAKPKVGKTTLLHQMAIAVARGDQFLGRCCEKGPVVYLALEEHRSRVAQRLRGLGTSPEDSIHLLIGPAPDQALGLLRRAVVTLHAKLAIIDPIQRLTRLENINDYSEVSNATEPLISIARDTGCSVVFSHHLGKMEREGADQILGSTALFGSVDTAIILRRRQDKTRTIETVQRYGEDLDQSVLEYSSETGESRIVGSAEEVDRESARKAVMDAVSSSAGSMTRDGIEEAVPIRGEIVRDAISSLVRDGRLIREGIGKRGNPYTYSASLKMLQDLAGEG